MDANTSQFIESLREFAESLSKYVATNSGDWSIKGFIDVEKNIYTISSDTKIISKILEVQIFPQILEFANDAGFNIELAEKQNWYPDLSFVHKKNPSVKFAVDIKTSYCLDDKIGFCSGFTLGSHGEYFKDRSSTKNIQYPYGEYLAHVTLGILYTRKKGISNIELEKHNISNLDSIDSVIGNLHFFVQEKWRIASDRSGSGNTANIGSIKYIPDLLEGRGVFINLGEEIFDEYWTNYNVLKLSHPAKKGTFKRLTKLEEFLEFRNMDTNLVYKPKRGVKKT